MRKIRVTISCTFFANATTTMDLSPEDLGLDTVEQWDAMDDDAKYQSIRDYFEAYGWIEISHETVNNGEK